jgi:hypothetical protein
MCQWFSEDRREHGSMWLFQVWDLEKEAPRYESSIVMEATASMGVTRKFPWGLGSR